MDERTQRGFDTPDGPCWRMSQDALNAEAATVSAALQPGDPLILVAPGPVFNLGLL
jgi:hypothetical protein